MVEIFKPDKIIIVLHEATTGPAHDLRDFLLKKGTKELLFIAHPLFYVKGKRKDPSRFELYKNGKLVKKGRSFRWVLPEYLLYLKDLIYTLLWSQKFIGKSDYFFGVGNLNAFAGHVLRVIGMTREVIYYVIDYIPNRFQNNFINSRYHWIEKYCAAKSNWTWNLSPRMIEERQKRSTMTFPNQLVVLHGVHINRIKQAPFSKINKYEILYMGGLLKKQGVQLVIEALPIILERLPNVTFTIIGSGEYGDTLKELVKKLHLEKYVTFLGYIANHEEVENRTAKASIAVALYEGRKDNFTYYTDPGKVKNYLGAGVPVIITDVPYIAGLIQKAKCAIIVRYKKQEVAEKLVSFLSNEKMMREYRINAVRFAKKYDWDKVFTETLAKMGIAIP